MSGVEVAGLVLGFVGLAAALAEKLVSSISSEKNQWGLEVLNSPEDPQVDIIFVHGLQGHPRKSWTSQDKKKDSIFWPRDMLPKDLPEARICTYGYKSDSSSSRYLTQRTFYHHSIHMLKDLTNIRKSPQEERRPLIFVGHSLGGLLIKSALIFASESELSQVRAIELSTHGVMFFATPHQGSNTRRWGRTLSDITTIVSAKTPSKMLENLERDSAELEFQLQRYKALEGDFQTHSFYESTPLLISGKERQLVVEKSSAVPVGSSLYNSSGSLPGDHVSMIKFSGFDDLKYKSTLVQLRAMCSASKAAVQTRWERYDKSQVGIPHIVTEDFSVPHVLPRPRNHLFVPRLEQQAQIDKVLFDSGENLERNRVAVLVGMAGIGKTEIVAEFAYSRAESFTSIFWVYAETREKAEYGFTRIAQHLFDQHVHQQTRSNLEVAQDLSLPLTLSDGQFRLDLESQQARKMAVQAVKEWLARKLNTNWLLIFDNLESIELADFVPDTLLGNVIITSRNQDVGRLGTIINVPEMTLDQGLVVLARSSDTHPPFKSQDERDSAASIALTLGGNPLALATISSIINQTGSSFCEFERERENLSHSLDFTDALVDPESRYSIRLSTAFMHRLKRVEAQSKVSLSLLRLCAMLDPDSIPVRLFYYGLPAISNEDIDDGLHLLESLSLVSLDRKMGMLYIHRLVGTIVREKLGYELHNSYALRACLLLSDAIEVSRWRAQLGDVNNQDLEAQLLPHIKICLQRSDGLSGVDAKWAGIAVCCSEQGWYKEAAQLYTLELAFLAGAPKESPINPRELQSMLGLSFVLLQQGKLREAEEKASSVLLRLEGADEGSYGDIRLFASQTLATVMTTGKRFDEAEELYQKILDVQEKDLGVNHPKTLKTLSSLASSWREKGGSHGPAEMLYRRLVTSYTKIYGADHVITSEANLELAMVCLQQGKLCEAEHMYNTTLEALEMKLGPEHPNTLRVIARLAVVADMQGEFDLATERYEKALSGMRKCMGNSHPEVLKVEENLALSFRSRGKYEEADRRYVKVLEYMKANPSSYPDEAVRKAASKRLEMYRQGELPITRLMALEQEYGLTGIGSLDLDER